MSSEIDARNAIWENELTDLNAKLWRNMKAAGVRAYWRDPFKGEPVHFTESVNDVERRATQDEFYEFVVEYEGAVLAKHTKHRASVQNTELIALMEGANRLETRGVKVMPF